MQIPHQTVFTADNLDIMRGIDTESIDLIYLDPPFNSNRHYQAPIGSKAAGAAFKDAWTFEDTDAAWWGMIADDYPALYKVIDVAGEIGNKGGKAYLIYMAIRLLEMHRILKKTGSIYLHCDDMMSHSLKLTMDSIFGKQNFQNHIIWKRTHAHNDPQKFGRNADTIYFYSKSKEYHFQPVYIPYSDDYIKDFFKNKDRKGLYQSVTLTGPKMSSGESDSEWKGYRPSQSGRSWSIPKRIVNRLVGEQQAQKMSIVERLDLLDKHSYIIMSKNGIPRVKQYLNEMPGAPVQSIWSDILPISSRAKERLGYPTQKPLELLKRIILASSREDDIVLDPFCGCATACLAAEHLRRKWIGIDISELAAKLVVQRMHEELGLFGDINHRTDIPKRSDQTAKPSKNINHILFGKQEGKCNGCQRNFYFQNLTRDHIIPKTKGGSDSDDNLQLLCGYCNSKKGSRDMPFLIAALKKEGILK